LTPEKLTSRLRWSLGLAAAVAALAGLSAIPSRDGLGPAAQPLPPAAASQPGGAAELRLPGRALSAASRDPFNTPPETPPRREPIAEVAPAPKAPPLPYQYDGFGELQGKRFVFLKREERGFRVSAGDTLEGTYRVEAIARDHLALLHLPLGIRQVLMYDAGAEPPAELAEEPAASRPLALQVEMPAEVVLGQEFVVTVALPDAGPVKATFEIGYDVEVLNLVGARQRRGREIVELPAAGAPRAQLRFKVTADSPTSTDINLQANATDASGKRLPVSTPSTYSISLVLAGGA
jgi:hypothetical protein